MSTIIDEPSPTEVAASLAKFLQEAEHSQHMSSIKTQLLDGTLDLSNFEDSLRSSKQEQMEEYVSQCAKSDFIEMLQSELDVAESCLEKLSNCLVGFQADLSNLSSDIRLIQEESWKIQRQVQNRKAMETNLRTFLQKVVLPPNLAFTIIHGEVDMTFLACVRELQHKYEYVVGHEKGSLKPETTDDSIIDSSSANNNQASSQQTLVFQPPEPHKTIAGIEVKHHLEKLRLKAIARSREFFLNKIGELRKPKTNISIIQANSLLKFAPLADFLRVSSPEIYSEIRDVYTESMSKTIHALFRVYHMQLSKLDAEIVSRHDSQLIAVDSSALHSVTLASDAVVSGVINPLVQLSPSIAQSISGHFSSSSSNNNYNGKSSSVKQSFDAFYLGERERVLDECTQCTKPIMIHLANAEHKKYPYEQLFRSLMMHLMDCITNEFVFDLKFFKEYGRDVFRKIFNRTLGMILEVTENFLLNCNDSISLLLMINIVQISHKIISVQRRVRDEDIDDFFVKLTTILWPKLKALLTTQIRSIRMANARNLGLSGLHSHYVARRYAELTSSLVLIIHHKASRSSGVSGIGLRAKSAAHNLFTSPIRNESNNNSLFSRNTTTTAGSDALTADLLSMQQGVLDLLGRMSMKKSNKDRSIFYINNLDSILSVFQERKISSYKDICEPFEDMLTKQREIFVEEELKSNFGKLIMFIQNTENERSSSSSVKNSTIDVELVESLVRDFASNWQKVIEQINKNVLSYFSSFKNGLEILKQALTQLLLYYTRFQDILRKSITRGHQKAPDFMKDIVSTQVILVEIKKYALTI